MQADQPSNELATTSNGQGAAIVPSFQAAIDSYRRGLEPHNIQEAFSLAQAFAKTGMCRIASAEDALARIMTGRELGLTSMQSIRGVYMVEGTPGLAAALMHALCLQAPECERFECIEETYEKVVYAVKRRGMIEKLVSFSIEDAKRAKLYDKGKDNNKDVTENNWHKYPKDMMHARCKAFGARQYFPERVFGLLSIEEIRDGAAIDAVGVPIMEAAQITGALTELTKLAADLKTRIASAATDADKKAIRAAITEAEKAGDLVGPALDEVKAEYNAKFAAKKATPAAAPPNAQPPPPPPPASDPAGREPGQEG